MADMKAAFQKGVDTLFDVFEQKIVKLVLINITEAVYDPLTQETVNTETKFEPDALKLGYKDKEIDNVRITQNDIKLMVKNIDIPNFEVDSQTMLTVDGVTYNVVNARVQGVDTITVIQARKP